ncbi:hypothetical protein [Jiangella sp. DSM 45060]|uniref:hypothetical protein n=1 Tax=Jiangella sp. DSM 45060 TaxID=1798224 RepID=UPI00087DA1AD|nr:hypothetical protein [Jiangella sp. DSM 45060]SDT24933.1 hypothetical protein SAMN04515669_3254 [Jiangella sp. DSM 45060]
MSRPIAVVAVLGGPLPARVGPTLRAGTDNLRANAGLGTLTGPDARGVVPLRGHARTDSAGGPAIAARTTVSSHARPAAARRRPVTP